MNKIIKILVRFIINHFLCCTHFFAIKRILLIFCGIKIGKNTKIVGPFYFGNSIKITIGDNSWIGKNFSCDGDGIVKIGKNVNIAPNCVINTGGHEIGSSYCIAGTGLKNTIIIGDGTWICSNVLIVNNTTIGSGNVIAAGAVVICSSKNNYLIAGVPASEKKKLEE